MAESIEQLKIYISARALEDEVYNLVKQLPADQFSGLGNDLRHSSSAVSHHIAGAHRLFSYRLKLDELVAMRREAEAAQKQLKLARNFGDTEELISQYTSIIQHSLGLTEWIKAKFDEKQGKSELSARKGLVVGIEAS